MGMMRTWEEDGGKAAKCDVEMVAGAGKEYKNDADDVRPTTLGARFEDLAIDEAAPGEPPPAGGGKRREAASHLPRVGSSGSVGVKSFSQKGLVECACRVVQVVVKTMGLSLLLMILFISLARWPKEAIDNANTRTNLLSMLFVLGLTSVALEDIVHVNKSSVMMVLAATMWTFLAVSYHPIKSEAGASLLHHELNRGLEEVGSVILFLLPAMGLVESIDHFGGFAVVTLVIRKATRGKKERLMPIITFLTFMLSSVIDNLTATIVALKLLRHLVPDSKEFRQMCGGAAVIAANAGGAWSPIGDVTTTMLWIQGKISVGNTIGWLFLPSFVAGSVPLLGIWSSARSSSAEASQQQQRQGHRKFSEFEDETGDEKRPQWTEEEMQRWIEEEPQREALGDDAHKEVTFRKVLALALGIAFILLVPVLKMWTGLPPYLGMLLALGLFWLITDSMGGAESSHEPSPSGAQDNQHGGGEGLSSLEQGVVAALHKVDLTGLLFFTGVLLAVGALDSAGVLRDYANLLVRFCGPSPVALCSLLGVSSAVVDNVPLVEAAIEMFKETSLDDPLWQLVALAAGTGGSILSIGSIAGVTLMSMEGVGFLWYAKRIGIWAAVGFAMGILTYQAERALFG